MRAKILSLLCCITLLLPAVLSGCGGNQTETTAPSTPALTITLQEKFPTAYVGEAYDLSKLIQAEQGVKYEYDASYVDPESGKTVQLRVRNKRITPKAETDLSVTITATKGQLIATTNLVVPVVPVPPITDIMDTLMCSEGIAGAAGQGVTKTISMDPTTLQGENSTSSLEVSFQNPADQNDGAQLITLSHYALHNYYTAQLWPNAAVTFRVYNPMEEDIRFKLASFNNQTQQTLGWGSPDNIQIQTAKAGQWTTVVFSLYDMGITQAIINTPAATSAEYLKLLARFDGEGQCKLYIDGLDIVPAATVDGLVTGYVKPQPPQGDYSDLLNTCSVYTDDPVAQLRPSTNGNGSKDALHFGVEENTNIPSFHLDFQEVTDISGFDYLKFDVNAENCTPKVTASIRYIDDAGNEVRDGHVYNFKRNVWQTLYLNLDSLERADLTRVVGITFFIHIEQFASNVFNGIYFDNVSLYVYENDEPQLTPPIVEENDILNAPVYMINHDPGSTGVCKVTTDETGTPRSQSSLLLWTNTADRYPTAILTYSEPQDWSEYNLMYFETHQADAHYWMCFKILYLDEYGAQRTLTMYHDSVFTNWFTTNAPLQWFKTETGESATAEHLKQVVGFTITVDFANNVSGEVGYIFFDNFKLM